MSNQEKNSILDTWREGQEWTEAHKAEVLKILREDDEKLRLSAKNNPLRAISSGLKNAEDAAMDETEIANGLNLNAHTQQDCAQMDRMIEALRDGSFKGKCSCGAVIPPARVALCASFQCVNCAIIKEYRQKTKDAFKSAYQGGVRYA